MLDHIKENDTLILKCNCDCSSGISFAFDEDVIWVNFFESLFYSEQRAPFDGLRTDLRHARNGYFFDIVVPEEDLLLLKTFLSEHPCLEKGESNLGRLEFEHLHDDIYIIALRYKPSLKEFLARKLYQVYEMEIYEPLRLRLIQQINDVLESKQ